MKFGSQLRLISFRFRPRRTCSGPPILSTAEFTNTAVEFVKKLRHAIGLLKLPGGRLPNPTTQRLKNLSDAVQAVARDSKR
jgi:hypothetical protein